MTIDINQKKISIGDKYAIFVNGLPVYRAARQLFKLFAVVNLFAGEEDIPKLTIKRRFAWFRASYDLIRADGTIHQFRTVSFWKNHYECVAGTNTYAVYGHRGRKYSIFKNDRQVAWWNKQAVTWFAGDNYQITADADCDVEMVIGFCLIVDNFSSDEHDGNAMTVNLGRIGPQAMKFDENWQPRT